MQSWRLTNLSRRVALASLLISLCLLTCVFPLAAMQIASRGGSAYFGEACLAVKFLPFQAGFYWNLPIFSYIPSLGFSPYRLCISLPANVLLALSLPRQIAFPP